MNPLASLGFIIREKVHAKALAWKMARTCNKFYESCPHHYVSLSWDSISHFSSAVLKLILTSLLRFFFIIKARQLPKAAHFKTRKVPRAACMNCLLGGTTPHSRLQRAGMSLTASHCLPGEQKGCCCNLFVLTLPWLVSLTPQDGNF